MTNYCDLLKRQIKREQSNVAAGGGVSEISSRNQVFPGIDSAREMATGSLAASSIGRPNRLGAKITDPVDTTEYVS